MLYLLYGPDNFRLMQKLQEIEKNYTEKYGSSLSLQRIDIQETDEKTFWDILNQNSLFAVKKLLIVENGFSNPNFKKAISKKIKDLSVLSDVLVFIEKKEIKQTDSFFIAFRENGKVQEFNILTEAKLLVWIKKSFEQNRSTIEDTGAQKLLDYVGNDMWRLNSEIKKLSAFKKNITSKDIEMLVQPKIEVEIFKTIDAFASKNKRLAFKALQNHLDLGENSLYLLSMISFQMRNLLLVKAKPASTARDFGMHPSVFRKSIQLSRNFSLEQLKKSLRDILETDRKIKTGQDKPEQALKSLIVAI